MIGRTTPINVLIRHYYFSYLLQLFTCVTCAGVMWMTLDIFHFDTPLKYVMVALSGVTLYRGSTLFLKAVKVRSVLRELIEAKIRLQELENRR